MIPVAPEARLPIAIVTGFLGAGKTTLLRQVLRDPGYADSAVIVNEFGEIALDHDLIAASEEMLLSVSTGCLCCVVRSDLTATLLDLRRRRAAGEVPAYARVLVETSGLADPAPILHALMTDAAVAATHRLHAVVTLVDALHGGAALDRHPEAARQAMLADRILLTKPDLASDHAALKARLRTLNGTAPLRSAVQGAVPPDWLFAPGQHAADPAALAAWLEQAGHAARHSTGLAAISLEREAPIPALALTLWMQGLAEHAGGTAAAAQGAGADRRGAGAAGRDPCHPACRASAGMAGSLALRRPPQPHHVDRPGNSAAFPGPAAGRDRGRGGGGDGTAGHLTPGCVAAPRLSAWLPGAALVEGRADQLARPAGAAGLARRMDNHR
ncbi:GTP-binding protein [Siccirubricoccus sp. G192]|nr:GTP-binding protein [Siccirubricoccus sp. G192]MBV1798859.1 GTP-binding protein [Siccirubricoccus sp. G192]